METDRNQVNLELAKQKVEQASSELDAIAEEVPGLDVNVLIANAERQALLTLLINANVCTRIDYYAKVTDCLNDSILELQSVNFMGESAEE